MDQSRIITITQLNTYVKSLLEGDNKLNPVYIKGEISNLVYHSSGHIYFSLKDNKSTIKAVMFRGNAQGLKFRLEDGMKVIGGGSVTLYGANGAYQIVLREMYPEGVGELNLAFEQLKKKLSNEALFDPGHKKPIPELPDRIGVITSPTGAAIQDICRVLNRRYPIGEIIFYPVLVQGENAAAELTEAVNRFNELRCADVIIIGRGGGSIEELWAFNDERLARAIYASEIPVISAVGHETDFTICDFVSDVRASTPSVGAELASPIECDKLINEVEYLRGRLFTAAAAIIEQKRMRLDAAASSKVMKMPAESVNIRRRDLDHIKYNMKAAYKDFLSGYRVSFAGITSRLDALSPLKILSRGYSIAIKDGRAIRSSDEAEVNDELTLILGQGKLHCKVTGKEAAKNEKRD